MKNQPFLKIDKRVEKLNETEAYIYAILVYAKFTNKQISRNYISTAYNDLSANYISRVLQSIESAGLITRKNITVNAYKGGEIKTMLDYTLNYNKFYMLKFNSDFFYTEDKKAMGFALKLRTLAFDDTLAIRYNKKDMASKLGISPNTLSKYLNKLISLNIISEDATLSEAYFQAKDAVCLSNEKMSIMESILSNSSMKETKLYKQLQYFKDHKLYTASTAEDLFNDIMAGVFANTKEEKPVCEFKMD